jgi:hypothetical protein
MRILSVFLIACALFCGCCGSRKAKTSGDLPQGSSTQKSETLKPLTEQKPNAEAEKPIDQSEIRDVTVRDVLSDPAFAGRAIRISGTCLGYAKPVAEGGPPLTRSDWQLEDGGVAIWVSGPVPDGCSPTEGSKTRSTIAARVAQDTLQAFGGKAPKARRYLIVAGK